MKKVQRPAGIKPLTSISRGECSTAALQPQPILLNLWPLVYNHLPDHCASTVTKNNLLHCFHLSQFFPHPGKKSCLLRVPPSSAAAEKTEFFGLLGIVVDQKSDVGAGSRWGRLSVSVSILISVSKSILIPVSISDLIHVSNILG